MFFVFRRNGYWYVADMVLMQVACYSDRKSADAMLQMRKARRKVISGLDEFWQYDKEA